jgi:hypothetical protein
MNLTKHQLTFLSTLRKNRLREPTVLSLVWDAKFELLIVLLLMSVGYWIAPYDWMRWFIVGCGAGGVWGVYALAFARARMWPVMSQIVNWDKVEELTGEKRDHAA